MTAATVPRVPTSRPVRVVQVGAGGMGRTWLRTLAANPDVELVGLVDLDEATARRAADEEGHAGVPVATAYERLVTDPPDVLLNVAVPGAHHAVSSAALRAGLTVLSEKPLAPTVAEGLSLAAASEVAGRLLVVSQSRRYFRHLAALRRQLAGLGPVAGIVCEFFRAPHFGGFREEMEQPLLVDMAIHQLDLARDLVGSEPVSVYCESHNPAWSWFAGDASAEVVVAFASGARLTYSGSWCAPGLETSWNGCWRISAEGGGAVWDGDGVPVAERLDGAPVPAVVGEEPEETAGALAELVAALRDGGAPSGEVHANVVSLAMVEAAVLSARTGRRVELAEVLEAAYETALADEHDEAVLRRLRSWPSVHDAVGSARVMLIM